MILSILSLLLFNLSINKDSGVYEKGERAVVSCHTDIVPTDSLFVSVSYNNKVGQEFRILPTSTDFTVLEQALDSTCAVSIEVKQPESTVEGTAHAGEDHTAGGATAVSE